MLCQPKINHEITIYIHLILLCWIISCDENLLQFHSHVTETYDEGVAVVQWVGHGSFKREVPCLIPGETWWCQEGHPTSNAPVPH